MDGLSGFELRNLVEIWYHVLELFIFSFSVADNFSVCCFLASRIMATTALRFCLNLIQVCSLFILFAILYNRFRCLICLFIDELIQFGSFGRMRTVLFEIEDLAAFVIVSVNSFAISFRSSLNKMRFQSTSVSSCLYLL